MADTPEALAAAAALAKQQGVTPGAGNDDVNSGETGNVAPPPPGNDPPPPSDEEAAKAKEAEAAAAKEKTAEAEAAALTDKEATPLDNDVWGSTGHAVADSALAMLQNADVTPLEAKAILLDAVQSGDPTKIDKEALIEKVGEDKANLILAGVTTFVNDKNARNTQIVADIKEAAGGEDNWAKMAAWGKSNLPDADLVTYRGMIDAGGAQARFAVAEIATKYNADEKNSSLDTTAGNAPITGDGGRVSSARSTSRKDYVAELTKAHRDGATDAVLNEITAARHRGRAQGI